MRTRTRTGQDKLADIQNILHETVTGNRIVKSFNAELSEIVRFKTAAKRLFRANMHSVKVQSISSPLMDLIGSIAIALLLWIGRNEIVHGRMQVSVFMTFVIALFKLYDPVRRFAYYYNSFKQALGASVSIFTYFDSKDDVVERPKALDMPEFNRSIRFENVGFSYSNADGEQKILHEVDLEINAGEVLAVVGPSGAGKSTLSRLIFRFFDVQQGRITIDGQDVREITQKSLRGVLGIVPQDTVLFNDTIYYNILYGRPEASRDEVIAAARHAHIHDFVESLPEKYDTVVGERGLKLSGGEKQRVAIARTILKNPPILVFDEATSALDSKSEKAIQGELQRIARDRTTLVIAHRLSTVVDADEILVIDHGRIVERGTHRQLLARAGVYAHMWALQLTEQESDERAVPGVANAPAKDRPARSLAS